MSKKEELCSEKEIESIIGSIFFPDEEVAKDRVLKSNSKLVHYTSAEVAMSIIKNKEVWMRETSCMNDFSEIKYGRQRVTEAYNFITESANFKSVLNDINPYIISDIENSFSELWPQIEHNTYIACLSEHSKSEDKLGRLSMWRAYSKGSGVAIVMNTDGFGGYSPEFKVYSTPVNYLDDKEFMSRFKKITLNIKESSNFLKTLPREYLAHVVFSFLKFEIVSTKHPAFSEEKEWRVVYFPSIENSNFVKERVVTINGISQVIQAIQLKDSPEHGINNIEIPKLISHIIIGPTYYPTAMHKAFVKTLEEAGVAEPEKKVILSNIPLR